MQATSRDGTSIAYERQGTGRPLILVGGGLDDGSEDAPLGAVLAAYFTVVNYARRGRGGSTDTLPYAVERELEDLAALIAVGDGPAHVCGVSSGGMFALEAAAAGLPIDRLAVYDVPYDPAPEASGRYDAYRERLAATLAAGRPGEAIALFMRLAGASDQEVATARQSQVWPDLEALAPTLAYDAALYGPPPAHRLATITQPTLVVTGGADPFFLAAADAVAAAIPGAIRRTLGGQGHVADPRVLGPALHAFFTR